MERDKNSKELLAVRLVFCILLLVMLLFSIVILNQPGIDLFGEHFGLLMGIILSIGLVIFLLTRVTIPWSASDRRYAEFFVEELKHQEKIFVIPTICQNCKTPVELDRVTWMDMHTPLCQECQLEIKLRIIEKP